MRRAGFEVRVLPEEGGSWEDNPPSVIDFVRRDLRWCQGNLQYLKLQSLRALQPASRFQLFWAISMFVGIPFWTLIILLCALKPFDTDDLIAGFPASDALWIYIGFLGLFLSPKLFGFLDVILSRREHDRYGGLQQFSLGALFEVAFSFLLGANALVEKVFAWPGIGSYAVEALIASDLAPVQGFVLTMAILYVPLNLGIDLLNRVIDPRATGSAPTSWGGRSSAG